MNFRKTTLIASVLVFALIVSVSASSPNSISGIISNDSVEFEKCRLLGFQAGLSVVPLVTHEPEVKFNQIQNRLVQNANPDV
jgi:hypothetical protein